MPMVLTEGRRGQRIFTKEAWEANGHCNHQLRLERGDGGQEAGAMHREGWRGDADGWEKKSHTAMQLSST